jgi:hypothetical protein
MAYIAYNNLAYKPGHKKQVKNYILKVTFFMVHIYYHLIYYKVKHFLSLFKPYRFNVLFSTNYYFNRNK